MKNTPIPNKENLALSRDLQFFDLFKHTNFGRPDNGLTDGTYGQITTSSSPRRAS